MFSYNIYTFNEMCFMVRHNLPFKLNSILHTYIKLLLYNTFINTLYVYSVQ